MRRASHRHRTWCRCETVPRAGTPTQTGDGHQYMDTPMQESSDYKFVLGVMAGSLIGAGLAIWFAPRGLEIREQITGAATRVGERASAHFQDASARVGEAVD